LIEVVAGLMYYSLRKIGLSSLSNDLFLKQRISTDNYSNLAFTAAFILIYFYLLQNNNNNNNKNNNK